MKFNQDKVDEVVLALLFLNSTGDQYGTRAWKGYSWDVMDRLHQKGYISNPQTKALSVTFSEEGEQLAREFFVRYFDGEIE